jgi:SsrA-binding protein
MSEVKVAIKIITKNKRAGYDYSLSDVYEAGISLQGTEVKALRAGKCSIAESFVMIDEKKDECWILNMNIPLYEFGSDANHTEARKRKLLLNKAEILQIKKAMAVKGLSLIPTKIYFKGSYVKIEIALGKGRKHYDKRDAQATKDVERKLQQKNYD